MAGAIDPEIAALPIRQLELSGTTNKALKAQSLKTIGDLLSKSPTALLALGFTTPMLVEIAKAAAELSIPWTSEAEVRLLTPASTEILRPNLPKALLKHERMTYVFDDGNAPMTAAKAAACAKCGSSTRVIAHVDLAAYPEASLPAVSVLASRCPNDECLEDRGGDLVSQSVVVTKSVGANSTGRREADYPRIFYYESFGAKSSERTDANLLDHSFETIGRRPRVGGWPDWGSAFGYGKGWPKCASCNESLVLAYESPFWAAGQESKPIADREIDDLQHVMVCSKGCAASGLLVVTRP